MTGAAMNRVALMLESDGPGGAETMLLHLAEELRRRGAEVCPVGPHDGCGWLADEFRARGFEPETFTLRRPLDWSCVRGIEAMLRRRRVNIVHSHEFTMAVYGAVAARRLGLAHVITMHGGTGFADRWRRRAALRWAFRSSRVAAVSAPTRSQLAAALGLAESRIEVIPNGISFQPGRRARIREDLALDEDERLILAVGNLYPVKGHIVLLEALAHLRKCDGVRWRMAIAGRGGEEAALRAFAQEQGIGDRLHLLGYRADVPDLLAASDLYVMPSLSEGLPMALIEAMFAARPVVASAVGGIPNVVTHGMNGLLVPPGDPKALAEALLRLLRSPAERQRLATAAYRRASAEYSVEQMVDRYEELYGPAGDRTLGLPEATLSVA
jgi:glycosyltransferase involved in cell wall biosynthesis